MELGPMGSIVDLRRSSGIKRSGLVAALLVSCLGLMPASAEDGNQAFVAAQKHFTAGRWEQAADGFEAFALYFPSGDRTAAARYYQGEALIHLQRYAEARVALDYSFRNLPNGPFAKQTLFRLGEAAFLSGDRVQARAEFVRFRERYPTDELNAFVFNYLGECDLELNQFERARDYFTAGVRDYGNSANGMKLRIGLGKSYQRLGDYSSALRYFEYVAQQGGSLADEARLQGGIAHFQQGRPEAALAIFESLQNQPVKTPISARASYWIAKIQLAQRKPRDAAATAEEALEFLPAADTAAQLKYIAGEAWRAAGDRPTAMRQYQSVVEDHPDNDWADDAQYLTTTLAFEVRDYDAVDRLAVGFETLFPQSGYRRSVQLLHCRALVKVQRYEEALSASEELLVEMGDRPPLVRKLSTASNRGSPLEIAVARYCYAAAQVGMSEHAAALAMISRVDANALPADMAHDFIGTKAAALQGAGKHSEAVGLLRAHVQHHEPGKELIHCHSLLVLALVDAGQWNEMVAELAAFRKNHAQEGEVAQTALRAAERAYFAGQIAVAQQVYEQLIKHNDHAHIVAQATAGLAWVKAAAGKSTKINDASFAQLLEKFPDSPLAPQAILLRARAIESRGEREAAVHLYQELVERYPRSSEAPYALLAAARICDELQIDRDTVELLSRLKTEYPTYTHMDAVYYLWAWALIDLGETAEGNSLLQKLTSDFPRSRYWPDSAYHLAQRYVEQKEWKKAKTLLARFETIECEGAVQIDALLLRGKTAAGEENWSEVAGFMHKVLEQQADHGQRLAAEFWTAEAEYRLGQYSAAERRLARLEGERGQQADETSAVIALRRAQSLVQLRKWDAAWEIASELAQSHETFAQRFELDYVLGRCLLQQGKMDQAREAFAATAESKPARATETAATAQWMIGETYFREKNYLEALKAYLVGYEKFPNPRWQAASLLQAGKCYELLEDWAKACEAYRVLVSDYSQTPYIAEARTRLTAASERSAQSGKSVETIR